MFAILLAHIFIIKVFKSSVNCVLKFGHGLLFRNPQACIFISPFLQRIIKKLAKVESVGIRKRCQTDFILD